MNLRLRRGWRKYFWQRLHNPFRQTKVAFVVGCGRSGTSMLLHHLHRSWAVDGYNENDPAAFQKYRLRPLDEIEKLVERSYGQVALFKPVLNTPQSCQFLNRFPDARLVFVYRHYGDVVNSSVKRFGPADRLAHVNAWVADDFSEFAPLSPPEPAKAAVRRLWKPSLSPESAAALYWLFYNRLYFDLGLDQEERVKLLGYESLVANAALEIRNVCEFLRLKYEPFMADGVFSTSVGRDNSPPIDGEIAAACATLWQQLQAL
jgi:hypothetical protein